MTVYIVVLDHEPTPERLREWREGLRPLDTSGEALEYLECNVGRAIYQAKENLWPEGMMVALEWEGVIRPFMHASYVED